MKQQNFEIELKQPVIMSQQAATAGIHQSLDYIAGSNLLGLVAGQLYSHLSAEEAFLLFHSGHVRFLDALPVLNGDIGYPIPLSLHAFKAEKYNDGEKLLEKQIFDISKVEPSFLASRQPVQLRGFYLTESGKKYSPSKEQTLKTAIDAKQNRAAESQLFGYEALSKGQRFRFSIQASDEISDSLWEKLLNSLQGVAYLGRSRSAQFGRVSLEASKQSYKPKMQCKSKTLSLWLLSDMCLQHNGQNTLIPEPEVLGLPEGTIANKEKWFIRSRRYSAYNAYRQHYDKERQVLARGSILNYQLPDDFTAYETLEKDLADGLGLYTEIGLGQVAINPEIFQQSHHPIWQVKNKKHVSVSGQKVFDPKTTLISVLQARQDAEQLGSLPRNIAEDVFAKLCEKVGYARRYHAIAKGVGFELGQIPSRTQFGRFKELANQCRNDVQGLWRELTNSNNGMLNIVKEQEATNRQSGESYKRSGWELKFGLASQDTLGEALKHELSLHCSSSYFSSIVAELAMLGLSDQWEKCCLGINQEQEGVSV